jgi:hypothetical protein
MSKVYPCFLKTRALPPMLVFFSRIITRCPALAKKAAALNPENPLPITITFPNFLFIIYLIQMYNINITFLF